MVDASQVVVPLPRETRRGLRDSETLDSVIRIEASLSQSEPLQLVVADALISDWPVDDKLPDLKKPDQSEVLRQAVMACVIRRPVDGAIGVLAGYHWFGEWGRDTMIALPGIGIATGDWALVADVLTQWTRRLSMGMLPNRLEVDGAEESHNSADASLWYARAVQCWYQATQDEEQLHEMFLPALYEIQHCYSSGTRYGIRVDPRDGLLIAGMDGVQLTWMDAKVGEWVVTPRRGKCVELNALFYSLCIFLGDHRAPLDGGTGDADTILDQARRLSQNFASVFWDETEGALSDCVGEGSLPYELRPNQLLALSAGDELLDRERALRALQRVEDELLTPFGLRTLDPKHPDYQGNCTGSPVERDGAYHQGTVWPWLLGPLADAQWALRQRVSIDFEPLMESLQQGAIGHLSEIFDGDSPHTARGAIAQAWSASEVFRASQM
jgi:predicted glycogen debranching enzyme